MNSIKYEVYIRVERVVFGDTSNYLGWRSIFGNMVDGSVWNQQMPGSSIPNTVVKHFS